MNLLIHNVDTSFAVEFCKKNRLAHVTRSGILVVGLRPHRELSFAIYPKEWKEKERASGLFRFSPDFTGGTVHYVYDIPEELSSFTYQLKLEESEVHLRGSYCQLVTGFGGERLRPFRRESCRDYHTASVFSAAELGMLRLDANAASKTGELAVHRARIETIDGLVTMTMDRLMFLRNSRLAFAKLPSFTKVRKLQEDADFARTWDPVLHAHYQRWECNDFNRCDGHYHLD